jgi:SOS-response transcriptional repressor LexA
MMGLTERQAELVAFVRAQVKFRGIAPSYDEIREKMGLASKSGVCRLVDSLIDRGALVRLPGKARSLSVPAEAAPDALTVTPLPEVRRAIEAYAAGHNISVETACIEALRAYFVEAAAQ